MPKDDYTRQLERELAELKAAHAQLVDLLVARGVLTEGHRALLRRVARAAAGLDEPPIQLRAPVDKYRLPMIADLDCASLHPLCGARCCSFDFALTAQDLDEGAVRWQLDRPYLIRHDADGFCSHFDRATRGCTIWEKRPATCREYHCRTDPKVWVDFDARVPVPWPDEG